MGLGSSSPQHGMIVVEVMGSLWQGMYFDPTPPPLLVPIIIPLEEWNAQITKASALLAVETKFKMKFILGVMIAMFTMVGLNIAGIEAGMIIFPFLFIGVACFIFKQASQNQHVCAPFATWHTRGVTANFFPGGKHSRAKLTLSIPEEMAQQAMAIAQQNQQQFQQFQQHPQQQPAYGQQPVQGMPVYGQPVQQMPVYGQPVQQMPVYGQPVAGEQPVAVSAYAAAPDWGKGGNDV